MSNQPAEHVPGSISHVDPVVASLIDPPHSPAAGGTPAREQVSDSAAVSAQGLPKDSAKDATGGTRKTRVAFHKNRGVRTRQGDLTRRGIEELEDADSGERLSGKGKLSRYRTIVVDADARETPANCLSGRVLWTVGANNCQVQAEDGRQFACSLRRVLRTLSRESRNPVAAGDQVMFQLTGPAAGVVERVEPRQSSLSRGSGRFAHVIVANVDQVVVVCSLVDPPLKPSLIDRFLISAAAGRARAVIVLNKSDLADIPALQPIIGQYGRLGYDVVITSPHDGTGIVRLRELLRTRTSVFAGQSGVGKSTLLNAIQPGLRLRTGEVSEDSGKGRHTTRVAELLPLQCGGWVVDTPGVRQLRLWNVEPTEVEAYFREFPAFVAHCRFPDCTHTHESDCAVLWGVDQGLISPIRYASYVRIRAGDQE